MNKKGTIFSGMRPTGRLHIGHLSVLENWVALQEEYNCFFGIVDWHALTTAFDNTDQIKHNIEMMLLDWLSAGLDPEKGSIFIQSDIKEHGELELLLSMITPLSWLERVPTYKDQLIQLGNQGKDISTYGFLGYPLLMAADILVYRTDTVPVGEDQLPHLEFCREIARRFNYLYKCDVFPEPQAKLAKVSLLPGIDGRKMSKSYDNDIPLSAATEEVKSKVQMMVTDPARIKKTDPGHPEVCTVYKYHSIYSADNIEELCSDCRKGNIGCVQCKKRLAKIIDEQLSPIREKRIYYENKPKLLKEILENGAQKARKEAQLTMALVKSAMKI
ncbi:MAG: tryptophan--tRNA ligase [Clostridia bacterium]|nr:tryptophan--tRNA ligase [Clostridia bacterium]MDD4047690.1 tryptophan--tRNA ligase [Clostridia bacterium]